MELLGHSLDSLGKIMIAFTVLRVHHRVWREHKMDKKVFAEMKTEQTIGILGILLIIAGFILQVPFKL